MRQICFGMGDVGGCSLPSGTLTPELTSLTGLEPGTLRLEAATSNHSAMNPSFVISITSERSAFPIHPCHGDSQTSPTPELRPKSTFEPHSTKSLRLALNL
eukprot:GHVN01102908.1.p1 GENE.GHVN01102908.1~~GHVN01102908.1.p1  ORF type:complete len:101 (-),score=0.91 GHVN01102908.1:71-373(-)